MIRVEREFTHDGVYATPRDIEGIRLKPLYMRPESDPFSTSNVFRFVVDRHNSTCGNCGVNVFEFNTDLITDGMVSKYSCRLCKAPLYNQSEESIIITAERKCRLVQFFKRMWAMFRR